MTSQQILEELYRSKEFNDCIGKMNPEHLRDDLKSEVMVILCERPGTFIVELHEKKELMFFTSRVVCNMIKSDRSTFARTYRTRNEELNGTEIMDIPMNGRVMKEQREEPVYEILMQLKPLATAKNFSWVESLKPIMKPYDQNIVSLYMKHGSFRLIEEATGIPWESCYKTFNKAMKNIKEHVDME